MAVTAANAVISGAMVPKGWELRTIGATCSIFGRIGFRGYTKRDLVKEGHGAISISPSNMQDGKLNFSNCTYLSWQKYDESPEIQVAEGDTLLVKTGSTFGKTALVGALPEKATLNPQVVVLKNPKIDGVLLSYLMGFATVQKQIHAAIVGGAIPTLSQKLVAQFVLPAPANAAEQKAIAAALGDVDALLGAMDRLIAKKRDLKQAAMQQLLTGQTRLPGFSDKWERRRLEGLAAFITKGSTPTTYGYSWETDGVLFLRSECVSDAGLDLRQSMFISEAAHATLRRSEIRNGDILMTITGNVGRVVLLEGLPGNANINQHIARIRIYADKAHPQFVYHFLSQRLIREYYGSITTGQAYPQISLQQVRKTEVHLPSIHEQEEIASVLADMDAELAALKQRRDKTRMLKQGMMQELLTGRTRLV